jgi:hypothetical protein
MPLTFLYQSVIRYALLVFFLIKLFYYVYMVFFLLAISCVSIKLQRTNISHFFHFNLKLAWLSWMKISKNTCKIASFPYFFIFSLKSALLIFIDENTKNKHFPFFFHINLKSALLSSMKITKNTCKIASFPIFSTLTLNRFYLFSALSIFINEDTRNKHFPFFQFLPYVTFTYFHRWKYKSCFISIFFQL